MHTTDATGVLAAHFDNIEQQRSTMRLGMWMFLVTEALFFGGVFCAYTVYRIWYPTEWEAGSSNLNVLIASINSLLLLTSSLTITLAIHAAHKGNQARLKFMLLATAILGISFLGFKAVEYTQDINEHLVPGAHFLDKTDPHEYAEKFPETNPARVQLFFMFYYIMTGLHVVHMIIGIGVILWLYSLARKGKITTQRYLLVEITSLYWHFVDLVWLFLMPLLYLAGTHHSLHF